MADGKTLRTVSSKEWRELNPPREEVPAGVDIGGGIMKTDTPEGTIRYTLPGDEGFVERFPGTGGDVKDLSHLESYIYTGAPGAPVPERLKDLSESEIGKIRSGEKMDPRLQAFADDPELAQRIADFEVVRRVDPNDPRLSEETRKNVQAAQARIEQIGQAPAPPQLGQFTMAPVAEQAQAFENYAVQEMFGGTDPRTRNVTREIQGLGEDYWRETYEQMRQLNPSLYQIGWDFMNESQKAKAMQQLMTVEADARTAQKNMDIDKLNNLLNINKQKIIEQQELQKEGVARYKAEAAARRELKTAARKSIVSLGKDLTQAREDLRALDMEEMGATEDRKAQIQEDKKSLIAHIDNLEQLLKAAETEATAAMPAQPTAVTEKKAGRAKARAEEAAGMEGGQQTRTGRTGKPLPPDREAASIYADLVDRLGRAPNNEELEAAFLEMGYDYWYE